jgi:hypothetical protein
MARQKHTCGTCGRDRFCYELLRDGDEKRLVWLCVGCVRNLAKAALR